MRPRDLIGTEGGWHVRQDMPDGDWTVRRVGVESSMTPRTAWLTGGTCCALPADSDHPHLFARADETAARLKANALNTELQYAIIEAATKRLAELKEEREVLMRGGAE